MRPTVPIHARPAPAAGFPPLLAAAIGIALLAASGRARATPPVPPSSEDDVIHKLMVVAEKAYGDGDHKLALDTYREAWTRRETYELACNIGRIELRYGEKWRAAQFLERCLELMPSPPPPSAAAETRELHDARGQVARITVKVDTAGVDIYIDGERRGASPIPKGLFVNRGTHRVEARFRGRSDLRVVDVEAKDERTIEFEMAPLLAPPPFIGPTPVAVAPVSLEPRCPRPIPPKPVPCILPERDSTPGLLKSKWLPLAGGTVSVAALGTGIGLLATSDRDTSVEVAQISVGAPGGQCPNRGSAYGACGRYLALKEEEKRAVTAGVITTTAGVAFGALAIVTLVRNGASSSTDKGGASITPNGFMVQW